MRHPPFDKKEARQAANYAIDRQAIIEKLMGGLGKVVPTVINPMAFGYDPSIEPYGYDPKKAKELLKQAGYPNGVDITLHTGTAAAWNRQSSKPRRDAHGGRPANEPQDLGSRTCLGQVLPGGR